MTWQGARKGVQLTQTKGKDFSNDDSAITPGKLADESKLGGINQLIVTNSRVEKHFYSSIPLKKRYREGWTPNGYPQNIIPEVHNEHSEPPIAQGVEEAKTEICENNNIISVDKICDDMSKGSAQKERACKGKRYLEFIGGNKNSISVQSHKNKSPPKKKLSKVQLMKKNLHPTYYTSKHHKTGSTITAKEAKTGQQHNLNLLADLALKKDKN